MDDRRVSVIKTFAQFPAQSAEVTKRRLSFETGDFLSQEEILSPEVNFPALFAKLRSSRRGVHYCFPHSSISEHCRGEGVIDWKLPDLVELFEFVRKFFENHSADNRHQLDDQLTSYAKVSTATSVRLHMYDWLLDN
jgi:hypothetical protein